MKRKEKKIELKDSTIYQTNENCQVFNGPISGCVFAMPGSTVNQSPIQQITTESDAENGSKSEVPEEPLRNYIFNEKLFDSNARLAKLRDTIAAAIDMGDATIMYGEPQLMRINPAVQNEWYYIVKAISESGVAKLKISDTEFVEQMVEWFPMLFPDETPETFKKYKRRLLKSISAERRIWKQGKMNIEVTLKEMWTKGISHLLGTAKAERVYDIAYKGLYMKLTALKQEIAKEVATR